MTGLNSENSCFNVYSESRKCTAPANALLHFQYRIQQFSQMILLIASNEYIKIFTFLRYSKNPQNGHGNDHLWLRPALYFFFNLGDAMIWCKMDLALI